MSSPKSNDLKDLLQEAQDFLFHAPKETLTDFPRMHKYLTAFLPLLRKPRVPAELIRTAATLLHQMGRFQEAAVLLKRLKDPNLDVIRVTCDFYSGYYVTPFDWLTRQEKVWEAFTQMESSLSDSLGKNALLRTWEVYFPSQDVDIFPGNENMKGSLLLGNPDGIYSLFPMRCLLNHKPQDIAGRWEVSLDVPVDFKPYIRIHSSQVEADEIYVRVVPCTGFRAGEMVDLEFWHPALRDMAKQDPEKAENMMRRLVYTAIPMQANTLYVHKISIADARFDDEDDDILILEELRDWFEDNDMPWKFRIRDMLPQRLFTFTRESVMVTRPRGDIVRGATCMPELEEIYFLRDGKALSTFQRYGVACWFLIIPKEACTEGFPAFRDALITAVREQEGDTVYFTGWAEGTRNYYIDFLSLRPGILHTLQQYLEGIPGGKDIRIASFYWNSVPRTVNFEKEADKMEKRLLSSPEDGVKEQVSAHGRAVLEKAFLETKWEKGYDIPDWEIEPSSCDDDVQEILDQAVSYMDQCRTDDTPFDRLLLQDLLQQVRSIPLDPATLDDEYRNSMCHLLEGLGRFRESLKLAAPIEDSEDRIYHLYYPILSLSLPISQYHWESRRQAFWKQFADSESDLFAFCSGGGSAAGDALTDVRKQAAAAQLSELSAIRGNGAQKAALCTGLPDGILTLPAMLYFTSHYPGSIGKRWDIAISWDKDPWEVFPSVQGPMPMQDIQVSLTEQGGKVSLALWHPWLHQWAEEDAETAHHTAAKIVNAALPVGARLLYVSEIAVADEEPAASFPAAELRQQMEARGFQTDISLDRLLSRRRYTITRTPKNTGRPRDDIVRGETCMPELERIYYHLYDEGQEILDAYGLSALFLIIPNALCNGDPAQYRQRLQRIISQSQRDQVFFTGWAEGTRYSYLDLITMDGRSLVEALNEYAQTNPVEDDLRLRAFYWDSIPVPLLKRAASYVLLPEDEDDLIPFAEEHLPVEYPAPDPDTAAAFEASFRPDFTPEDFRTPKAPPAAAQAPAAKNPLGSSKKLSKAQRNALNSKNSQNSKNNKGGKNKKKR